MHKSMPNHDYMCIDGNPRLACHIPFPTIIAHLTNAYMFPAKKILDHGRWGSGMRWGSWVVAELPRTDC